MLASANRTEYERERDERIEANKIRMEKVLGDAKRKAFPSSSSEDDTEEERRIKKMKKSKLLPKSKPLLFGATKRTSARDKKVVNYAEEKVDVSISTPTLFPSGGGTAKFS